MVIPILKSSSIWKDQIKLSRFATEDVRSLERTLLNYRTIFGFNLLSAVMLNVFSSAT